MMGTSKFNYGKSPSYKCVHFKKFIFKVFVSNLFPIDNIVHKILLFSGYII